MSTAANTADPGRAAAVLDALEKLYPDADCELDYASPFQLLVATVLSAQSTDRRVNSVTPELFARYPTPAALAQAEPEEVANLIGPVGFQRQKAQSLVGLSRLLVDDYDSQVPVNLDELVKLPGVGRKTANVVLGNAFQIPGLTPDTHFMRLAARLGWNDTRKPEVVERAVAKLLPEDRWVQASHLLIWHGRRRCHARRPACGACTIAELCPSYGVGETNPELAETLVKEPRA